MKIFSWNVNGLRAVLKKGELQKFFAKYQPDILCVQETRAGREPLDLTDDIFNSYQFWHNDATRPGYAGTAVFAKKNLSDLIPQNLAFDLPEKLADRYNFRDDAFGDTNAEGRILTLEFANFFLTTVYTPNSKGDLSRLNLRATRWDPAFRDYMSQLREIKPVIFCGDLNVAATEIDLANPKQNIGKHGFTREERAGFQAFLDAGFRDSFREFYPAKADAYTWWSHWAHARERNVGWRIDYFLVDEKLREKLVGAEILAAQMGSDHCPINIEIQI